MFRRQKLQEEIDEAQKLAIFLTIQIEEIKGEQVQSPREIENAAKKDPQAD